MALARRLVELGRSARASAAVKIRQPLARALVSAPDFADLPAELAAEVADELNVRLLEPLADGGEELVSHSVKANFRSLGRRFGSGTQAVAAAIARTNAAELATALFSAGAAQLEVDGQQVNIGPDDVVVTSTPHTGWAVAAEGGETVAVELTLTPELRREGLARDFVRLVQEARKNAQLAVTDRIRLRWSAADPEMTAALTDHGELISAEVLAVEYAGRQPVESEGWIQLDKADLGLTFWIRRAALT
jgi:isoleucyl-tRNA synthetase